jgi:hypothetical protein
VLQEIKLQRFFFHESNKKARSMKSSLFCCALVIVLLVAPSRGEDSKEKDSTVAYVKASLPNQIFRCIQKLNLLRCLKYFVLLRLEARDYQIPETEDSTSEFLGSILKSEQNLPKEIPQSLMNLGEDELNKRLTDGFQRFFKNRPIMLRFIPNVLVKIIPSKSSDLEFSLKRFEEKDFSARKAKDSAEEDDEKDEDEEKAETEGTKEEEEGSDKGAMRKKSQYLQVGVPLLLAPAMVFAGFLPMLIPVLKLATAFTTIVNTTALVAAVLYLARQHAFEKEMQQTVYFNPGYKERRFA